MEARRHHRVGGGGRGIVRRSEAGVTSHRELIDDHEHAWGVVVDVDVLDSFELRDVRALLRGLVRRGRENRPLSVVHAGSLCRMRCKVCSFLCVWSACARMFACVCARVW